MLTWQIPLGCHGPPCLPAATIVVKHWPFSVKNTTCRFHAIYLPFPPPLCISSPNLVFSALHPDNCEDVLKTPLAYPSPSLTTPSAFFLLTTLHEPTRFALWAVIALAYDASGLHNPGLKCQINDSQCVWVQRRGWNRAWPSVSVV